MTEQNPSCGPMILKILHMLKHHNNTLRLLTGQGYHLEVLHQV